MRHRWKFEQECLESGYKFVAGVDEVGMGCLAGPVVAAAVIFMSDNVPTTVRDSKILSHQKRMEVQKQILECAVAVGIGHAEVEEIDSINIYHAGKLAMVRAIEKLTIRPDFLLIDGRGKLEIDIPQKAIIKGDSLSLSIGAASIVAKVFRDAWMERLDAEYPGYGFAQHKGYGSVYHRRCLQEKGRSAIHRKSFSWTPVDGESANVGARVREDRPATS